MAVRQAILTLILAALAAGPAVAAAPAAKPIVTNKTRFRIPFRFDAAALQKMNARELRLYVSQDGGATWELTQSIGPDSGKFEFQAPADGEYRFSVKTLDGRNQLHPPGETYETGLVVVVDTTPPQLQLDVRAAAAGKVELRWAASDDHLDTASLKLEYSQPGVDNWQTVSVVPRSTGQTSWTIPQGGLVAVRGSILDQAGNPGETEMQASIPAGNGGGSTPNNKPDFRQPVAESPAAPTLSSSFKEVTHPFIAPQPQVEVTPKTSPPQVDAFAEVSPETSPKLTDTLPTPVIERPPVTISNRMQFTAEQPQSRPEITQDRWSDVAETAPVAPPATGRQRIVNTKKFQIGYKIDDIGPSGLGGVELFVTQDGGRKWWKYGDDPDQQSPFDVEVPDDGAYGFEIRARSGVGLSEEPPAAGQAPSIVVVVDQTPPTLELLPVRQGTGTAVNQLQLRWKIGDAHPSDKPVAIYYSASPNGPWETISPWRPDTGEFVWTMTSNIPSSVYFRIVARDAAGNAAQQQTDRPVIVDLAKPSAKILDVASPGPRGPQ